jgi:iron complex transport system ATP-binding protein
MQNEIVLNFENAIAGYSAKHKISEIVKIDNISAKKAEIIALIGINGAGKSTFLKSIIGLNKFISGNVFLKNINIKKYSSKQIAKIISFVSSEIITAGHLTVFDLVALGRYPHTNSTGKLSENDIQKIENAIETVGLKNLTNKSINEISDGERQRVMIARALAQDTEIIIMDEPASFLDLQNKYAVYGIMKKLAENQNKTIIFSTHDINIALKFSDKLWIIYEKNIIENSPEDIILSGLLNNIFENKNIIFDTKSLDYKIEQTLNKPINVKFNTDNSDIKILIENALKRNGFYIDLKNEKTFLEVQYQNKKLEFQFNRNKYFNFYELISALKNYSS